MPFTYSVDRGPSGFAVLRATGPVTLVMWSHAMRHVVADQTFHETIVLDLTEATGPPPHGPEIPVIVGTWRLFAPHRRGAIIASQGPHFETARGIEQLSGGQIRTFADFQAGVQWLREHAFHAGP